MDETRSPSDEWLTIKGLSQLLGVGEDKIRARLKSRTWPSWRDGRTIRFTPEHIQHIKDIGHVAPRGRRK